MIRALLLTASLVLTACASTPASVAHPDILDLGASHAAESFGGKAVGRRIAEKLGATYEVRAHAGKKLHLVMPADDATIAAPWLVISMDGLYWYGGFNDDYLAATDAIARLLRVRAGKLVILGSVPFDTFGARRINAYLRANCTGSCILILLEGDLAPPDLHPEPAYVDRVEAATHERLRLAKKPQ